MEKSNRKLPVSIIFLSALIYFLADFPVQGTGFLTFGSYIGIKNFLPGVLGLQFGFAGIIGSCIGCVLTALFVGAPIEHILFELACICIVGTGSWILWHLGSTTHKIHFKRIINITKYIGILLLTSSLCGLLSYVFIDGGAFLSTLTSYTFLGFLIGFPVSTICNSVLCIEPILPPPYKVEYALTGSITSDPESIGIFNDSFEEFAFAKKIPPKRMFEVQNCIEELSIRILSNLPDTEVNVFIDYDDTISARFVYGGQKHNPLLIGKDEDELDIISLTLVKHRALRAAYKYRENQNHIHIVL